jgi:nicotinamidase-related amidase
LNDILLNSDETILVIIDVQPTFMKAIWQSERVLRRTSFLLAMANLMEVPVLATTQYADRMGSVDEVIARQLGDAVMVDKMAFSCASSDRFLAQLERTARTQVLLCGIETHICVTQTALELLGLEYDVYLALDAISARDQDAHEAVVRRMSDAGVFIAHSESAAYEWMRTAEHPKFREALELVKSAASPTVS